jgi:chorismate mutase
MGIKIKDPRLKSLLASARPNSVIGIMSRLSGYEGNPFMDDPEIYESALKTEIEKEVYNQRFTAVQNVGLVKEYFADLAGFDTGSLAAGAGGAGFFYGLIPDSGFASKFAQAKTDVSEAKQVIADLNKELNTGNMTPDQAEPIFREALEQGYRGQAAYKKYSNYGFKFAKNKDMADPINTDLRQLEIDIRQSASKWGFEI